ncbi:MAG TPA: ribose-phosphate pyrophosphokinase [bacterium]|nr:ribose-phosphate pyrophosphokinase [bacterium]
MKPLIFPSEDWGHLARSLCRFLPAERGKLEARSFPDGETYLRIRSACGNRHAVIAADLSQPDPKILKLIFLAETLRAQGASPIGLVAPYLPYMRQDKSFHQGEAVTSKSFANLLSGRFDWLVTVDPHLHRYRSLSEVYTIPTRVVPAAPAIAGWIRRRVRKPFLIGPDQESEQWVSKIAEGAKAPFVILHKERRGDRKVTVSASGLNVWQNHRPVLVDDIISTGNTMMETIRRLKRAGFKAPICIGVHGIFSGSAYEDLLNAGAGEVVTTNTIPHSTNKIDLGRVLADAARPLLKQF